MYLGDIVLGDTLNFKFTTRSFSTGAPTQLAGTPVISAYPGSSTTQLTAGITLTVDFDSVTGCNHVTVAATAANGYLVATTYQMVITTGTVGGVSVVGEVVAHFSINHRSDRAIRTNVAQAGAASTITLDASASATDNIYNGNWVSIIAGTGIGQTRRIDSYVGSTKVATLSNAWTTNPASGSVFVISPAGPVSSVTGSVGSVATGGITTASFAAGAIDAAAIAADAIGASELAADAATEIGTAVWAATTRQLTGTQTFNLTGSITGNLSGSVGSVTGAVGSVTGAVGSVTGNVGGNVTGSVGSIATGGIAAASFAANAIDAAALAADAGTEIGTAVWATTTRVLTANTNLNDPTAAAIADAVWDEVLSGHLTAGSTGNALNAAGAAGDPWTTALPGAYGAGTAGNIIGNNLDAAVSSRASQTSVDTVDGIVDAILVDTAEIGLAGAGLTNINLPDQTMNITGNLSGSVGSVTGLTAANLDVAVSTRLASAGYTAPDNAGIASNGAAIAALNDPTAAAIATAVLTTQMTEAYAADGVAPTLAQAQFLNLQLQSEKAVAGTTMTVKKLDGTTTAATFTLDDATNPTSITRAT